MAGTVYFLFVPATTSLATATVTFLTNDPSNPTFHFAINGTGFQATNLNGSFKGTVGSDGATLSFSGQNAGAKTIMGTLLFPNLFNLKSSGPFTGSMASNGKFSFSRTTSFGTLTLTGQESSDGTTLTGMVDIPIYGMEAFSFKRVV